MGISPLAGKPAPASILVDLTELENAYYQEKENLAPVAFGTSGHRGSSIKKAFNETHILATTQAICEYRVKENITGTLFIGFDSHALSFPAFKTALQVLAANGVKTKYQADFKLTATPLISHAILTENKNNTSVKADGIVITPSHNPPEDGGFKYNSIDGGPANTDITNWVQNRANEIIANGLADVKSLDYDAAIEACEAFDFIGQYVDDLPSVIDIDAIKEADVKMGVDPLGGASLPVWEAIKAKYDLNIEIVNDKIDPQFGFMCVDRDGKVRMDCSSSYAMAGLIELKDKFDVAFGNDPDSDRHGIVCPSAGLMNPNHYLAVAIQYLFQNRPQWPADIAIGKTLVSSSMIDKVAAKINKKFIEVPVGFKWFVDGLVKSELGFGGEESAGASFLRKDASVWSTDKDGIIPCLLAAEIIAVTKQDPGLHYQALEQEFGAPIYERIDAPASKEQKETLKKLNPEDITQTELAGEAITAKLSHAPGNKAAIGGLKVTTESGWFAARPSGTEDVYKIYAESFKGADHLKALQKDAQELVDQALS